MNIVWNRVTWYSRLLAVIFFVIVMPILAFYIGTIYEETKLSLETTAFSVVAPQSTVSTITDVTNTQRSEGTPVTTPTPSGIQGILKEKPCLDTDPTCADSHTVIIVKGNQGIVTQTTVPANGKFVLYLDPGTYMLSPSADSFMFASQTVVVKDHGMTTVSLAR